MAGLSGLPALDVDPLSIGARNFATTESGLNSLQQYQMGQTLMPDVVAAKQAELQAATQQAPIETQQKQTALGVQQQEASLRTAAYGNDTLAQIAKDAQAADPEEAPNIWDSGMKAAAAKGVTQASQYIGHYRPDLAERVGDIYGAPAQAGRGGAAAGQQIPGIDPDAVARTVAGMPAPQVKTALGNLNRTISSFNNVKDQQSWDGEIQMLRDAGIDPGKFLPNLDWNPLNYAAASRVIQRLQPLRDAMATRMATEAMGAPQIQPKPMYEPMSQYVGTDQATGRPIYHDIHGGADTMGNTAISPKPSAGMATFMLKQQAYLASHPGDATGALEFANGKRNMSPSQMEEAALNQANKELGDATLSGATIPDPDGWVRQKAAQNYALISGASVPQSAPGGAPGPGGGPGGQPAPAAALPARAIDVLRKAGGQPVKFNNGQSWKMGPNGKPVRVS